MSEKNTQAEAPSERAHVGDSRFESWFSQDFDPKNKGTKQQMREAYEAGMNDRTALATQQAGQGEAAYAPLTGKVHELKTDATVFSEVVAGRKLFEIRKDDRGFACGDLLRLRETTFTGAEMAAGEPLIYTGQEQTARVIGILRGPKYGLADGWVIMSIATPPAPQQAVQGEAVKDLVEAVDTLLDEAICECPHKMRFEDGEHFAHCYLFDVNVARTALLATPPAPQQPEALADCPACKGSTVRGFKRGVKCSACNGTGCAPQQPEALAQQEREALMTLFTFMQTAFVPMTSQQEEIRKQLDITAAAIRAARSSEGGAA